ncbi:MAG: hypothetical protein ACJA0H_002095 [Francisellaceae bacterium]|jgi:hypothetical protein
MAVYNLYSKRQKQILGDVSDIYSYNYIPKELKIQIKFIIQDTFGSGDIQSTQSSGFGYDIITNIHNDILEILRREYALEKLSGGRAKKDPFNEIMDYFMDIEECTRCVDIIEIFFSHLEKYTRKINNYDYKRHNGTKLEPKQAIIDLNTRFKEHAIGYEYVSGEIIRIDSQIIHSEAVKPVINLLKNDAHYKGSNAEFLKAHKHYRHGNYKGCINECLNAFESILKAIFTKLSWEFSEKDTVNKLFKICFERELVPAYLQSKFTGIRTVLEGGVGAIRNRESGHGDGVEINEIPQHLARYTLHLTASNILFLSECYEILLK